MWACTQPLQSAYAAAELVSRGRVVVLVSVSFEPLFGTSSLDHSEARDDQGRRVKQEFKNERGETALFCIA